LLFGSTKKNRPEHAEFFLDLDLAKKRLDEVFTSYREIYKESVYKKETDGEEQTIIFGKIKGKELGKDGEYTIMEGSFQDEYMIALSPCEDGGCYDKSN
jgi:hypothetical protein